MIYKAFSNLALPILISYYPSTCPLDCSLIGPAPCSSTCVGWSHLRAFARAVSSAWDNLLPDIYMALSLTSFRSLLLRETFSDHLV